jgi:tripartite-type tricarboxylate transporter receptor subunit TctC
MKKLIILILSVAAFAASAKENVQIHFPFLLYPSFGHKMVEEANKLQDDWNFVIVPKIGAGGVIAAQTVINENYKSLLAGTSSFFIRPLLYKNTSYDIKQFRTLIAQCDLPMVVVSKKYKSFAGIETNQRITIAVTGLGATTHVVALEIMKKFPNVTVVPYSGVPDTLRAIISGDVDMAVGFVKQLQEHINSGTVAALGITGNTSYLNIPTLKSQKFAGAEDIANIFFLAAGPQTPPELHEKWRKIFEQANTTASVQQSYKDEFCTPVKESGNNWINVQHQYWKNATSGIKIEE